MKSEKICVKIYWSKKVVRKKRERDGGRELLVLLLSSPIPMFGFFLGEKLIN